MSVDRSETPVRPGWGIERADHLRPKAAFAVIVLLSLGLWSAIWLAVSYVLPL